MNLPICRSHQISFVEAEEEAAVAILRNVESANSSAFQTLLFVVAADYYEAEVVLRAFGWSADPPQPRGYRLPQFDEALLTPVKDRPALWRTA